MGKILAGMVIGAVSVLIGAQYGVSAQDNRENEYFRQTLADGVTPDYGWWVNKYEDDDAICYVFNDGGITYSDLAENYMLSCIAQQN